MNIVDELIETTPPVYGLIITFGIGKVFLLDSLCCDFGGSVGFSGFSKRKQYQYR